MHVYSELGKGSCFIIEMPLAEAPQQQAPTPQLTALQHTAYKVLCLDNDETILQGMRTLLSKWGYQIFTAT